MKEQRIIFLIIYKYLIKYLLIMVLFCILIFFVFKKVLKAKNEIKHKKEFFMTGLYFHYCCTLSKLPPQNKNKKIQYVSCKATLFLKY